MSLPCKLAILISGNGSNLQAFIDAIAAKQLNAEISLVISNKAEAYGLVRAAQAGIPSKVISKSKHESPEDYDAKLLAALKPLQADWIILAGFMRILTTGFIEAFPSHILNIHPALLPKYKGLHTHQRVLEAGDKEHGSTVHIVTPDLDAGPSLAYSKLTIAPGETEATLKASVQALEHKLYPKVVQWLINGKLHIQNDTILYNGSPLSKGGILVEE